MKRIVTSLLIIALGLNMSAQTSVGPWVTNVSDHSATILWTGETEGTGWVETEDGTKVYDCFAGRRTMEKFHEVTIRNVSGTLKYRVGGEPLLDASNPRTPKFGESWNSEWHEVKLFDNKQKTTRFSVMNDIHLNVKAYKSLKDQIPVDSTDFLFLNGDIASLDNYTMDKLLSFEIAPLGETSAKLPVFFARGNHEGRGTGIKHVGRVYPNNNQGHFYYTFRQGNAAVAVFDGGETGTRSSRIFCGKDVYEEYIAEQLEWAKKALFEKEFKSAPLKIVLLHVPMIDHPDKNDYHLQRYLNEHLVPLLNKAGIDIMIGADLHEHMECLPGTMGNNFPILVNANINRLDFKAANGKIDIDIYSPSGEHLFKHNYKY